MGEKWLAKSKTIQGIVFTLVGFLSQQFGWDWWQGMEAGAGDLVNNLIMAAGSAYAMYGMRDSVSKLKVKP